MMLMKDARDDKDDDSLPSFSPFLSCKKPSFSVLVWPPQMRHGFLLVDKPVGPTSHDCVDMVRKALSETKVGHLGTLDPAASGLLVMAVGAKALKVIELFDELEKEYEAEVTLGAESTTYDREGVITEVPPKPGREEPNFSTIQNLIQDRFIGKIDQVPPGYSAVKIGGERAYQKMRQGRGVNIPPRQVEITSCEILSYEYPTLTLTVNCGSGTYIRSLAHDLGSLLRCGGYLSALRRTKVGEWKVEDAVAPKKAAWGHVIALKDILTKFPRVELTDDQADDTTHGRDIPVDVTDNTIGWYDGLPIAILTPRGSGAHARKVL